MSCILSGENVSETISCGEIFISDLMLSAGMVEARRMLAIDGLRAEELSKAVTRIYESMERWKIDPRGESTAVAVVHPRYAQ